jgi:hypothetical protein
MRYNARSCRVGGLSPPCNKVMCPNSCDVPQFVISSATLDLFATAQTARANEALVEYLQQRFPAQFGTQPREDTLEIVRAARMKARKFGIEREDNLATFLDLTVMYPGFPDLRWAINVLNANTLHGPDKMAMLRDRVGRQGVEI